jgi:hypothetical protein
MNLQNGAALTFEFEFMDPHFFHFHDRDATLFCRLALCGRGYRLAVLHLTTESVPTTLAQTAFFHPEQDTTVLNCKRKR